MTNRPSTRNLVRWNDDHDKELLMWIVYCCGEQGIKLPFARVAQCMGAKFTEGAIIQHLAKIRTKMDELGLHVPPAQKRGTVTRTGSSIYRPTPKVVGDPVPRVRPDSPPVRGESKSAEHECEEEDEQTARNARPRMGKKSVGRQSRARKSYAVVKNDTDEDDPLPALFGSDDDSASPRSISAPVKNAIGRGVQMKLNSNNKSCSKADGQQQSDGGIEASSSGLTIINSSETDPPIKYESFEDSTIVVGTRRKSSALMFDNDDDADDDYVPERSTKIKARTKKPKGGRTTKKQKTNNKDIDGTTKDKERAELAGYQETSAFDADRAAMPPPVLPMRPMHSDVAWNNDFMHQPFAAQDGQDGPNGKFNPHSTNDGSWNDFSPMINHPSNSQFMSMGIGGVPGIHNYDHRVNYYAEDPISAMSSANGRNHSFASASSASTVESQPMTWRQPYRSPGFPNPQEATQVLSAVLNTPGADASTFIDVSHSPMSGQRLLPAFSNNVHQHVANVDLNQQMDGTGSEADYLFIGTPDADMAEDDTLMQMYMSEEAYGGLQ